MLTFRNNVVIDINNLLFTPHIIQTVLLSAAPQLPIESNMTLY